MTGLDILQKIRNRPAMLLPWALTADIFGEASSIHRKKVLFVGNQKMPQYMWEGRASCLANMLSDLLSLQPDDMIVIANSVHQKDIDKIGDAIDRGEVQLIRDESGTFDGELSSASDFVFESVPFYTHTDHMIWRFRGSASWAAPEIVQEYREAALMTYELSLICAVMCCIEASWPRCNSENRLRSIRRVTEIYDMFALCDLGEFPIPPERLRFLEKRAQALPFYPKLFTSSAFSIALANEQHEYAERLIEARERYEQVKRIWQHCLSYLVPVPMDLRCFNCQLCKGADKWDARAMHEIGKVIGIEDMLRGLCKKIPYDDLIVGART